MGKPKIKLGIFGGAGILAAHAPGYKAAQADIEVVAVAEPVPEKASRIRDLLGGDVAIFPDYATLLAQVDVDAVDILLPHHLHWPATVAAAEAGKQILVEKVMARNIWECDRMIEACDKAGVTLTVCHDRRYHEEWVGLKQVVESGVLGDIAFWELDHNQDFNPCGTWAASWDLLGGGAIMSCLTHQIDTLRWLGGELDRVSCMTKVMPQRMEGETCGVVISHMANGALARLSINWMTRSNREHNGLWYEMVHVTGEHGEAYYMSGRGTYVLAHNPADLVGRVSCEEGEQQDGFVKVKTGQRNGHVAIIGEWVKLLRGEPSTISTTGRDCRCTVEVAEAAYQSVAQERVVHLPIVPVEWQYEEGAA